MSPHVNEGSVGSLSRIEELIDTYAEAYSGNLTPHRLMECLKGDSKDSGFSHLGSLIETCLNKDELDIVRWVVFHFDLPTVIPGWDETSIRNWIAVRISDQFFVDKLHMESVGKGAEFIKNIYAPSVVSAKMKAIGSESHNKLREKWWIYRLDGITSAKKEEQHRLCCQPTNKKSDILCFNYESSGSVHVLSCSDDIAEGDAFSCSLGHLLNEEENETEVANCYLRFKDFVNYRSDDTTKSELAVSCNFYARIPVFFYSEPTRYMTEIFVAFYNETNNIQKIVNVLEKIVPPLRICVSLINSQIAYAIGHRSRVQEEIQAKFQEQAHTMVNNFTSGILQQALSINDLPEIKQNVRDALIGSMIIETSIGIVLGRGLPEELGDSVVSILRWLSEHCESDKVNGLLLMDGVHRDISFNKTRAVAAFNVLWNLWDNAEKAARRSGSTQFNVELRSADGLTLEVEFRNRTKPPNFVSDEWRDFLLGFKSISPNIQPYMTGLEIVKRNIDILGWKITAIETPGNKEMSIIIGIS